MHKRKLKQKFCTLVLLVILLFTRQENTVLAETLKNTNVSTDSSLSVKGNGIDYEEYSIITETVSVKLNLISPKSASFNLKQDSYVVFSAESAAFWGLDKIVDAAGYDSIYMTSPKRYFLKKGIHNMYLLQTNGGAEYINLTYTIYPICKVYSLNGENVECIAEYTLQKNSEKMDIPEKAFQGCTFDGWFEEKDYQTPISYIDKSIGKDWYIYPKLIPIEYTITYELNDGENHIDNPISFTINDDKIDLKAPIKEGYIFDGWYSDPAFMKVVNKIDPSICRNFIVYAKWKKETPEPTLKPTPEPTLKPTPEPASEDTVKEVPELEQEEMSLFVGEGEMIYTVNEPGKIIWTVENPAIIKITSNDNTEIEFIALAPGQTKVFAKTDSGTSECMVIVKKPVLKYNRIIIKKGKSKKNKITGVSGLAKGTKVKWKSENKKVATVKNGKINAKKTGKAKMTVTINNYKISFTVIVKK